MLAVVVYLFSPIDLIPDFLVLFGITDDLVVISTAMWFLGKVVPEKVKNSLPMDQADSQVTSTDNTQEVKKTRLKRPLNCLLHPQKQALSSLSELFCSLGC